MGRRVHLPDAPPVTPAPLPTTGGTWRDNGDGTLTRIQPRTNPPETPIQPALDADTPED